MRPGRRARARRQTEQVCPLCRDTLAEAEARRCAACQTAYHPDCLLELGGCATLGCRLQGALPADEAAWRCWTCHDPIDAEAPTRCGCGASLHADCLSEHATGCRRARPLLGPPTPGRLARALASGLLFAGVLLGLLPLLPGGAITPPHGLLALALGVLPLGLHLLDARRREATEDGLAALRLAEPLLLGLGTGAAVTLHFSRLLHSLPQGLLLGAVWGFFGALLGLPLLGATDCLVLAPRRFAVILRSLLTRLVVCGAGFTALASPLYLTGVLPLSVCLAGVTVLSLLAATATLGRGRGAPFMR